MKIGIVGGGISGTFLAIKIKEYHPDYDVEIFEHNPKLIRKIYATGNGKCNFANSGDLKDKYNNEKFVLPILNDFSYKQIASYFEKIGIPNILDGELAYPMSKSAQTVGLILEKRCYELGVTVHLNFSVSDYQIINNKINIISNEGEFTYDKVVIACGGKSSPQLGSDGALFNSLLKHGYEIKEMYPSLCPIKTFENTKMVEGVRCDVSIEIYNGDAMIHKEDGELLFKDKGLSGIVIFNACHYINLTNKNDIKIHIDFLPKVNNKIDRSCYINYVNPKLAEYLLKNNLDVKNTIFKFKDFYDYSTSQVTSGGVSFDNLNASLESKIEHNLYFVGESLDVDAVCGGFNIMWALASANLVAKEI